ncbi:unnamed protein product, partial [Didymodactylos carnosus]
QYYSVSNIPQFVDIEQLEKILKKYFNHQVEIEAGTNILDDPSGVAYLRLTEIPYLLHILEKTLKTVRPLKFEKILAQGDKELTKFT